VHHEPVNGGADDLVHVVFPLEVDEDGWPPVGAERLWAKQLGPDTYRVENAPWFVRDIAADDVVRAEPPDADSWPIFKERLEWGGNCTIRVIPFQAGALAGSLAAVIDVFTPLGVTGEGAGTFPIVALTIPPDVDLAEVKALLRRGDAERWWEYEEGCVSEEWQAL
jgi:hypothetical protein